jgi:peroxiredoxin
MARTPSTMAPLGTPAPPFSLPDPSGRLFTRDALLGPHGLLVVFLCNHCPFVKHIREGLADFARDQEGRGVGIVAISSNDVERYPADSPELMAVEAREAGYTFPYLYDATQEVAHAYGAACTPDFFLYDGEGKLVYRGQFDGSRPGNEVPVTGVDLRRAVDALVEGRELPGDQVPSLGCNIKWKPGNEPEWFGA